MAAEFATPEKIAFFLRHTSGVICAPITGERARRARPAADGRPTTPRACAPRSPSRVDYRHGTTTGISAADRAATIQALVDPATRPGRPGPPRPHLPAARPARAACSSGPATPRPPSTWPAWPACYPAGVLCEIVNEKKDDMARLPELERVRRGARPAADLHRRPHPLPAPDREAGPAGRPRPASPPSGATSPATPTSRCSTASSTSPSCGAPCRARTTCWCGCTASASPATCSARCAATAARSSTRPCAASPRRASAWSSTCGATRAGASASATRCGPTRCRTQGHDTVDANLAARPAGRQPRVRHRRPDPRRPRHHHDAAA